MSMQSKDFRNETVPSILSPKRQSLAKKVRLVEPASRSRTAFREFVSRWPLLGPITMATVLSGRGHDVLVYNENLVGSVIDNSDIMADLLSADFVGITAMTPTAPRAYTIAQRVRNASDRTRIVLGGVHATFCPEEALGYADYVVTGEGERALRAIVEDGVCPGIVKGIPVENLDELPLPDFDLLVHFERSWESVGGKEFYKTPVLSSRGCPYGCSYCSVTKFFGRRCRQQSPEKVIRDVTSLTRRGFRSFFFYDDNFSANFDRNKRVLQGMRDMGIRWNCQTRLDFAWCNKSKRTDLNTELLGLMREAGADLFFIGYETIDDATSKEWNKGYKGSRLLVERAAEDTRILHDYGFWIHGMFVVGPQHDQNTLDSIVSFSRKNKIESLQISALTPFPGTDIFKEMKDKLIFTNFPEDWSLYDGAHATYYHAKMGLERFQEGMVEAHKHFYQMMGTKWRSVKKFLQESGSIIGKAKYAFRNRSTINKIMKDLDEETAEFLRRVAQMNDKYLLPAKHFLKEV